MGFLSTSDVHECSATDLVGGYVGQIGPKIIQLLEKALGKVLLVDEHCYEAVVNGQIILRLAP